VKLGEIASPPLREMVAAFMKPSQNLETDLIFAYLGETLRPSGSPAWRTSEQYAVGALREFLRRNALPVDEVRFEEGSGLSRNNLASANATLALLTFMSTHREADAFRAALPIAGVDGTLRRRMRDTPAEGNVRAKTGTLRWANSLSGYVTSAGGERLAFSIMLNRSIVPTGALGRDDVDAIALMLAQFSGRTDSAETN
jgi:D-alanyl-D-alanine carboxypeptidase/D-alanyl-D-alanine-endopeptidase (penicillin-binding protein 4)